MELGKNICALRREKHWTQAQLAEKIGVTEQAVSKWETCQTAPDVSLFPRLEELFGVSTDRIFGYERRSYDEEVRAVQKEADECGDTRREIDILTDGLRRFPNSAKLKISLAFSLSILNRISEDADEKAHAVEKAGLLCEEVIGTSSDAHTVDGALTMLSRIFTETGDPDRALDAAERINAESFHMRIIGRANALSAAGRRTALAQLAEGDLWKLWWASDLLLSILLNDALKNGENERATAFCTARKKLLSVYDGGCPDFYLAHKLETEERYARIAKAEGNRDVCLDALRKFAELAERVPAVAASEDFHISQRNPLYFSHAVIEGADEEYFDSVCPDKLFESFDSFFAGDGAWEKFRGETKAASL